MKQIHDFAVEWCDKLRGKNIIIGHMRVQKF